LPGSQSTSPWLPGIASASAPPPSWPDLSAGSGIVPTFSSAPRQFSCGLQPTSAGVPDPASLPEPFSHQAERGLPPWQHRSWQARIDNRSTRPRG